MLIFEKSDKFMKMHDTFDHNSKSLTEFKSNRYIFLLCIDYYFLRFSTMLYESVPAETRLTVYRRAPAQKLRDGSTSNLGPNKCLVRVTPTLPLFNNSRIQISPQLTQQRRWAICAACERAFSFVYACAHLFFGRQCLS